MLPSAEFWVGVAFVIFWGILFYYGGAAGSLIRPSTAAASASPTSSPRPGACAQDAEALLREYEAKRAAAEREAAEIVSTARDEAERLARETAGEDGRLREAPHRRRRGEDRPGRGPGRRRGPRRRRRRRREGIRAASCAASSPARPPRLVTTSLGDVRRKLNG